jgi:gamma-glutamylcyclotransferase (GGCT)/AIG2-like uncharacterized protein YtfP
MTAPRGYFVYGTLRPGGRYWRNVSGYVEHYEPGYLEGFALHHLPEGYPAIVASTGQKVFGDLLFVRSRCESLVLDILDEIEGCNQPGRANLYDRIKVDVKRLRASGAVIIADTYVYADSGLEKLEKEGELVASGDWREFVASREELEP